MFFFYFSASRLTSNSQSTQASFLNDLFAGPRTIFSMKARYVYISNSVGFYYMNALRAIWLSMVLLR